MFREHGPTDLILKTLRFRPRGMTITEIAKQTHLTRNSVSKHLEVLRVGGHVDMCIVGNAKVFSLARRVPMSAFLCFTRNLIVVLDNYGNILQMNEQFLNFSGLNKDVVIGQNIRDISIPVVSAEETMAIIEGVDREQFITDVRYKHNNKDHFYQMQVIPTVFEDGDRGRTIVLEDITQKNRYVENMEFLAKTAMNFVNLPEERDVYQCIAEQLTQFIPGAKVYVHSYDDFRHCFVIRAVMDMEFRSALTSLIGHDPVGMVIPLDEDDNSSVPGVHAEIRRGIREVSLTERAGEESIPVFNQVFPQIPKNTCEEIVRTQDLGKVYMTFLTWNKKLLGDVGVFLSPHSELEDPKALESFIRQASIAISKRITEERLRRSNGRFREVVELSPFPAATIDSDGRFTFINKKFIETFGYTLDDIPTGRDWFEKTIPDSKRRENVIETWMSDLEQSGDRQDHPRTFPVLCKDGTMKAILFRPVTLCDKSLYITYEDVTELRRAHEILLSDISELMAIEHELMLKDLAFSSLQYAVAIADGNGLIRFGNPAFLSLWGYDSLNEVTGMHISELWTGKGLDENGISMLNKNRKWSGVLTGSRKDNSVFDVHAAISVLMDTNDQMIGLLGSFTAE